MNKYILSTFDTIKQEEASYCQSVESALSDYRRTMSRATEEAKQYKDESTYINGKKGTAKREAKAAIQLAENAFTSAVNVAVKSLRDDLHQHLTTRPSAAFIDALRLYYDFDIRPSHAEISALMEQNGGNTLGYRAINRTLEKTGAEWRIDAPDSAAYEGDLAALEKLAHGNIHFVPDGYLHEMSEVYSGERRLFMRDDGSTYDMGYKWDTTSLLMASTGYKDDTGAIDAMSDRWSSTVLPALRHIEAYQDNEETGETAAQQMAKDIKATATAPEIERDGQAEVEAVRQRAHEQAETDAKAGAGMEKYML